MNIKVLFAVAVEKKASDLHLVVGMPPILRIDGELHNLEDEGILTSKIMEQMAFSILSEEQKQRFISKREFDLSYELQDNSRFRVNLHFEKNNIGLVARVIKEDMPTLEEIEMPKIVYDLLNLKQGLILITGPTGCGKSTSLAAMVNYINKNHRLTIITLEDPIEYIFKPVKSVIIQRQLGNDMTSFAQGLKHVLRSPATKGAWQ